VQGLETTRLVTDGGVETAQYPVSIYPSWFRGFFIYVVPLACINYFPAMGLIDRVDPLGAPSWVHWLSPVMGVVFFLVSIKVWHFGKTTLIGRSGLCGQGRGPG